MLQEHSSLTFPSQILLPLHTDLAFSVPCENELIYYPQVSLGLFCVWVNGFSAKSLMVEKKQTPNQG